MNIGDAVKSQQPLARLRTGTLEIELQAAQAELTLRQEELQVIVDPDRLAARQLSISDIRDALRNQNRDTSGGDFQEGKRG